MTLTDTLDDVIHLVITPDPATATATVDASKDVSGTWGYPYPSSGAGFCSMGGSYIDRGRPPTHPGRVRGRILERRTLEKVGRPLHTAT